MVVTGSGSSVFITISGSWSVEANQQADVSVTLAVSSATADTSIIGSALYAYLKNNYPGFTIRLLNGGTVIDAFAGNISQPGAGEIKWEGTSKVFTSATSWDTIEVLLGTNA